ncbi:hypothetical protein FRC10_002015 [Ceratobasidium sp. 414]|nr:hypothetical protein FRC10_002015 [Ceratobasidium sp. 414]
MSSGNPSPALLAPHEVFQLLYRSMPSFITGKTELHTTHVLSLSRAAYFDAIHELAPDQDVHELDAELAQVNDMFQAAFRQQLGNVGNRVRVIKHAFLDAINSFKAQHPNGYTDVDGNRLPEPDYMTTYQGIVNMTTAMLSCTDEGVSAPRDELRERFTHLAMRMMDSMKTAEEIEESIASFKLLSVATNAGSDGTEFVE